MLSVRLQQILRYINPTDKIADIGCDHGYLAIGAIEKGVKYVQLIDNKAAPLSVAKKNLKNYEKLSKISYSLSDGLSKVDKKVNVACICGMGGDLVSYIIENKIDVARRLDYLILEANSKNEVLRKKISDLKFEIIDEDIVYDKKKYYQIMKIRYNEEAPKLSQVEILLGPILIKKHNQIFIDYLHNQLQTIHAIMEKNQVLPEKLNNKKTIMEEILNETI